MPVLEALPASQLEPPPATASWPPSADALVVYVLNIGDGDAIVLEFPSDPDSGNRAWAVVDSGTNQKTLRFLETQLKADRLRLICATHPHADHIRGLRAILKTYSQKIFEFWDCGFRTTSPIYSKLIGLAMQEKRYEHFRVIRPVAGYQTWIHGVRLTVLSPALTLRERYNTWGGDLNNASIVLRLEYPASPITDEYPVAGGQFPQEQRTRAIVLGGDAQLDAWSQVLTDFPHLEKGGSNRWVRIGNRQGRQPLRCDTLKIAHHGSKHGVDMELVERMMGEGSTNGPWSRKYLLASCSARSTYGFPHAITQEILREARQPLAQAGIVRTTADYALGIHYTGQDVVDNAGNRRPAGSMAVVMGANGDSPELFRFGDAVGSPVDSKQALHVK